MDKKRIICACAAVFAMAAGYLAFENLTVGLTEYEIPCKNLPKEFDGFRICHLSDIHVKSAGRKYRSLIKMTAEQAPDIIVISGDLIDSRNSNIPAAMTLVETLKDIAPVYFVTGNHEERLPPELYAEVITSLREAGAILMDGTVGVISKDGESVRISGMFDRDRFDAEKARPLFDDDLFDIFICHRPQFAKEYAEAGVDLTLCGHAHGGQVRLPFIGGLIAPDQYFFPKYYEGVHTFGDRHTVISRGIGNSLIPVRINDRPENVMITLRAEE